jgi:hypothetical protein
MSEAARRWYAMLLRLFPADFRTGFGREVASTIEYQRTNLPDERWRHVLRFHILTSIDLLRAVGLQRRPILKRLASGALLVAAVSNVGYDLANPRLSMGVPAWALTLMAVASSFLMSVTADRHRRPG